MSTARFSAPVSIEPLEARIAPASLTFTDSDGDRVTITTSKGSTADLENAVTIVGDVLQLLDLSSNSVFKGTDLTIEVTTLGGDGLVNVGYINAAGFDLGTVKIQGDLGQIDAGDAKIATPAIKSLEVGSLAALGVTTQAAGGSIVSDVFGSINTLKVNGNVLGTLLVNGGAKAGIGTLEVTGILTGGDQVASGNIDVTGSITKANLGGIAGGTAAESGRLVARAFGELTIDGDVLGGTGEKSGSIRSNRSINELTVTGDIIGGTDANAHNSGEIRAGRSILLVKVGGEIRGGEGRNSGSIGAGASLEVVTVGGGLFGGGGFESGTLGSVGRVESVTISGGITGGTGEKSGGILATARLNEIIINGDVTGGTGKQSGVIATDGTIAKVTINGSMIGGDGEQSGAIGSLKRIANVSITQGIQGGLGLESGGVLSAGTIGTVTVEGNVRGGGGEDSGAIGAVGAIDSVIIRGNLEGGEGQRSGAVLSGTKLKSVQIDGTIIGSLGGASGFVHTPGNIDFVSAGGIQGGSNSFAGQIFAKNIKKAEINGDIRSGSGYNSGSVAAIKRISSITLSGNLDGGGFEGGTAYLGGSITANRIDNVLIEGSIYGGREFQSGVIVALGTYQSGGSSEEGTFKPNGILDKVVVLGDVIGGDGSYSGSIISEGKINSVTIGSELSEVPRGESYRIGSLQGGFGDHSGRIEAHSNIKSVEIMRDLRGGFGPGSGGIAAGGDIKSIEIGAGFYGGQGFFFQAASLGQEGENTFETLAGPRGISISGAGKGEIVAGGKLGKLFVGESIVGGDFSNSAQVKAGSIGSVEVVFDIQAGEGRNSASISATKDIASVSIGGFLTTYTQRESIGGFGSASISAGRNLGEVSIGTVLGHEDSKVFITAGGTVGAKTDKQALAIKSVNISDRFENGRILAGYQFIAQSDFTELVGMNQDVQIGKVQVGTVSEETFPVWINSDIVAGAEAGETGSFGDFDDRLIDGSAGSKVISKIASVIINGTIFGGGSQGTGYNGIVAEHVASVKVLGENVDLKRGARNDFSVPVSSDPMSNLFVNEVTTNPRMPSA